MFHIHHFVLLYSCDQGQTTFDNYDERFVDEERELIAEVVDDIATDYDTSSWSGFVFDYWENNDSTYVRPNIFA